jgi:hypothetical protein
MAYRDRHREGPALRGRPVLRCWRASARLQQPQGIFARPTRGRYPDNYLKTKALRPPGHRGNFGSVSHPGRNACGRREELAVLAPLFPANTRYKISLHPIWPDAVVVVNAAATLGTPVEILVASFVCHDFLLPVGMEQNGARARGVPGKLYRPAVSNLLA